MIPTAIGLPTGKKRQPVHNEMQDWLAAHELQPYTPQARYGRSLNLAMRYDCRDEDLMWGDDEINETQRFAEPMVFHYGRYWYATRPRALRWCGTDQDALSREQLARYLANMLRWFGQQDIAQPWILIDEPPSTAAWGWTQEIEERVIKFAAAAIDAGWVVRQAAPGPGQLSFWRERLPVTRWILQDKSAHDWLSALDDSMKEIWLYNPETMSGIAERMARVGASGFLLWSATESKRTPLFTVGPAGDSFTPTTHAARLLDELRDYDPPPIPTPPSRVSRVAIFQTDDAAHWQAPTGLAAVSTHDTAIIQAEFSTVSADSGGELYANGQTPKAALEDVGVEVIGYVQPWWLLDLKLLGGPSQWLRRRLTGAASQAMAWLYDADGRIIHPQGRSDYRAVDPGNAAYREFAAQAILSGGWRALAIDACFAHPGAYIQDAISDLDYQAGVTALLDMLRGAGVTVLANAAWEMMDPRATTWAYPYREHVDGVLMEAPTGFRFDGRWWPFIVYDKSGVDAGRAERVIADWRAAGKRVMLVAKWQRINPDGYDYSPFADYDEHVNFWLDYCQRNDCELATLRNSSMADTLPPPVAPPAQDPTIAAIKAARVELAAALMFIRRADDRLWQLLEVRK